MTRWLASLALALALIATASLIAQPDDPPPAKGDPIREKLDKAKATYEAEWEKSRRSVIDVLSKREETARKEGNKKLVDAIKAEWEAFEEKSELPKVLPLTVRQKFVNDKNILEAAYRTAIKEYTKANKDELATAVEKELELFRAGVATNTGGGGTTVTLASKLGRIAVVSEKAGRDGAQVRTGVVLKTGKTHLWKIVPAEDGWVYVVSAVGDKLLTTDGGGSHNGAEMIVADKKKGDALKTQQWKVVPIDPKVGDKGWVRLEQRSSNKPFGVDNNSLDVNMRLLLWDNNGQPALQWKLEPVKTP